jgi:23S rRNA pseudouridine1911/1915/1917 synthase
MTNLNSQRFEISASAEDKGARLDRFLAAKIESLSRTRLKALILEGAVEVSGRTVRDPEYRVNAGDEIKVSVPEAEPAKPTAEKIPLDIVYEDKDVIVLDKPAGLVVHPAAGNRSGTLVNALIAHCGASLSGIGGEKRPGIVHRLDKDTSGLMVVARTIEAHTDLVRQLAAREITREYLAVAHGDIARAMVVDAPIGRHPTQRTTMAVVERGKPARTHVSVVERFGAATLVRCRLETGRTHQIRVHLAAIGHPLVGDPVYGARRARTASARVPALARQALHAALLSLAHPTTRRALRFESKPPADFGALVDALRHPTPQPSRQRAGRGSVTAGS